MKSFHGLTDSENFFQLTKEYGQNISAQHYSSKTSPRYSTEYIDERWSNYYKPMASKKLLQLEWCFTKIRKQWFIHRMETPNSSTLLLSLARRCIKIIFVYALTELHTSNVNIFDKRKLSHIKNRRYHFDAHSVDELELIANSPAVKWYLLQSLEQEAGDIGFKMNFNKTELII